MTGVLGIVPDLLLKKLPTDYRCRFNNSLIYLGHENIIPASDKSDSRDRYILFVSCYKINVTLAPLQDAQSPQ